MLFSARILLVGLGVKFNEKNPHITILTGKLPLVRRCSALKKRIEEAGQAFFSGDIENVLSNNFVPI
jgi:hypothetical protein